MKEISIAVPKDEPKLKAAVNKEITKLQKSGELDKLFKKAQEIQEQNTNK
jgi:polar amino acid transport system substrate-binding protein